MVSVKGAKREAREGGRIRNPHEISFLPSADASRRVNITCAELSNVTFTNAPPFDVLGVPECGDAVQPELVLYLPKNDTRWVGIAKVRIKTIGKE